MRKGTYRAGAAAALLLAACDGCGDDKLLNVDDRLAAPALLAPADGACAAQDALEWTAVRGAAEYRVEVARGWEVSPPVWTADHLREPRATLPPGLGPGPYRWRATAVAEDREATSPPAAFVLLRGLGEPVWHAVESPVCGGRPPLGWTDAATDDAATRWDLEVSPAAGGEPVVRRDAVAEPSLEWEGTDLAPGAWAARVRRRFHGCVSGWVEQRFETAAAPPAPREPAAEWHGCGPWQVRLSWQGCESACEVETTDPSGRIATATVNGPAREFATDQAGTWTWRVRARGERCAGAWLAGPAVGVASGAAWTRVEPQPPSFAARTGHAVAVSDDDATVWVLTGDAASDTADVWSSGDGRAWTLRAAQAPFPRRRWGAAAFFLNRLFLLGGNLNAGSLNYGDVWSSSDLGATWTLATQSAFGARHSPAAVVFRNRLWVVGGEGPNCTSRNDVWSSADGVQWTRETASAAFSGRDWHAAAAFDGRLWVVGGIHRDGACEASYLDDVWSSGDGRNWTREAAGAFAPRAGHTLTAFDGKLWVIAGTRAWPSASQSDVWYSEDGRTWCQAAGTAEFSKRYGHGAVVFHGRLWVLGGFDGQRQGDVWVTE